MIAAVVALRSDRTIDWRLMRSDDCAATRGRPARTTIRERYWTRYACLSGTSTTPECIRCGAESVSALRERTYRFLCWYGLEIWRSDFMYISLHFTPQQRGRVSTKNTIIITRLCALCILFAHYNLFKKHKEMCLLDCTIIAFLFNSAHAVKTYSGLHRVWNSGDFNIGCIF